MRTLLSPRSARAQNDTRAFVLRPECLILCFVGFFAGSVRRCLAVEEEELPALSV
jgi:hypothetical protein